MYKIGVGLLILLVFVIIFVDGARFCELTYSVSTEKVLFYINGNDVDRVSFCKAHADGCLMSSSFREWGEIASNYCGLDLSTELLQRGGRRVLKAPDTNENTVDNLGQQSQMRKGNHDGSSLLTPKTMAMAVPGMFLLCCVYFCPCFHSRRKATAHVVLEKDPISIESMSPPTSGRVPASPLRVPPSPRFSMSPKTTTVGSVHLNMSQVIKATQNFSPSLKVGEGGFGTVYRTQLPDGQVVAIKRATKAHSDSLQAEFCSEVEMLAKIEHRNLVKLLGYVDNGDERIIITEFVPNGTLRDHLDGRCGKILDFNQRLEISIDIAHALTYLHLYAEKQIIHRDVKSSNILLTETFRAKVADFGFARLGPAEANQTHILTKVKGTAGYLDPEYLRTYELTNKSDVYSYGILLVEILTSRRPVESRRVIDERITIRWAFKKYMEGNVVELLDPLMNEVVDAEVVSKLFGLAFQCAAPTRSDRPNMKEVGEQLWGIRMDYLRISKEGG